MNNIQMSPMEKPLLRVDETAKMIGVTIPTIYTWIRKGKFPKQIKLGQNSVAFVTSEVKSWISEKIEERDN